MIKNMGSIDRGIRLAVAALVAILILTHHLSGGWAIVLGVVAAVFVITSFVGVCPAYLPLKISTAGKPAP